MGRVFPGYEGGLRQEWDIIGQGRDNKSLFRLNVDAA